MEVQDKIPVEIQGRRYELEIEGLTPLEAGSLAAQVEAKLKELSEHSRVIDTGKLAVLAALNFADELRRLQAQHDELREALRSRVHTLKKFLEEASKNEKNTLP
ncbi:MAG: cell division protein ZapA [Elusimicrobia bacterium]|nr:cell division protein ZapA [Elusimicrobiota bacterium]